MPPATRGSPTEVADDSDDDLNSLKDEPTGQENSDGGRGGTNGAMAVDATGGSPGRGKRAREPNASRASDRDHRGRAPTAPNAAPGTGVGARAFSPGGDAPVTSREFRELLNAHLHAMTMSWQEMNDRVGGVEAEVSSSKQDRAVLHSRITQVERKEADMHVKVNDLARSVEQLREAYAKDANGNGGGNGGPPSDPWAEYQAKRGQGSGPPVPPPGGGRGDAVGGLQGREELSEDDKRTLIVGGWNQDSRRQTIIEEASSFLARDGVKDDVDQSDLTVWGPRRSFGVLKFKERAGEGMREVRDRMWRVIQNLRATPCRLPSTAGADGVQKSMWAAFTKTKEARRRGAHASMLRRVTATLARDARLNKDAHNPAAVEDGAFDMDWNSGSVWLGEHKLGSSAHRTPRGESIKLLTSGWVDVMAVASASGVTFDSALAAVERELCVDDNRCPAPPLRTFSSSGSTTSISRRLASWNVGGQSLTKIDAIGGSMDVLSIQEMPRSGVGWDEHTTDCFTWLSYQGPSQWRGVAIAVAHDLYDAYTDRISFDRGAAWVVRLKDCRRVILGSLHLPTGVPTRVYHAAVQEFRHALLRWHPDLPCFVGVDVNEVVEWSHASEGENTDGIIPLRAGAKLDKFLEAIGDLRMKPIAPQFEDRWSPTHFPRDESREGRHIDVILCRQLVCSHVQVNSEVRYHINTDHARLECCCEMGRTRLKKWTDTRPRWIPPGTCIPCPADWNDIKEIAKSCSHPRAKKRYVDPPEVRDACTRARGLRGDASKAAWRDVHQLRRRSRRAWQQSRTARILHGDWFAYRDHQAEKKKRCWWGAMLRDKTSAHVACDVQGHLAGKVWDEHLSWHAELCEKVQDIHCDLSQYMPIQAEEVAKSLSSMRARSSLGPDGVSVDVLRKILEAHPDRLCALLDEVLRDGVLPEEWGESLLALLPKTVEPKTARELRPIAMSCSSMKLLSKIVMGRSFQALRDPAPWSACGCGRSTADMHAVMGRLRDMCHEWRAGVIVAKLDVEGAFDFVSRRAVADYIGKRLCSKNVPFEWRFLLLLLDDNVLQGTAPGGGSVRVHCNRGIRQGSPESAELFGLLISDVINRLKDGGQWREPTGALKDLPADVGTYQDDIFVWTNTAEILQKNIAAISAELKKIGLRLAASKTSICTSKYYKGRRQVLVDEVPVQVLENDGAIRVLGLDYNLSAPASQQARELHGRVWSAFHEHKDLLCGPGSWREKHRLIQSLVEGAWSWVAGAVHWEVSDLQMMNSTQLRVLRLAFGIRRGKGEDWITYNTRSLRSVRLWVIGCDSGKGVIVGLRGACCFGDVWGGGTMRRVCLLGFVILVAFVLLTLRGHLLLVLGMNGLKHVMHVKHGNNYCVNGWLTLMFCGAGGVSLHSLCDMVTSLAMAAAILLRGRLLFIMLLAFLAYYFNCGGAVPVGRGETILLVMGGMAGLLRVVGIVDVVDELEYVVKLVLVFGVATILFGIFFFAQRGDLLASSDMGCSKIALVPMRNNDSIQEERVRQWKAGEFIPAWRRHMEASGHRMTGAQTLDEFRRVFANEANADAELRSRTQASAVGTSSVGRSSTPLAPLVEEDVSDDHASSSASTVSSWTREDHDGNDGNLPLRGDAPPVQPDDAQDDRDQALPADDLPRRPRRWDASSSRQSEEAQHSARPAPRWTRDEWNAWENWEDEHGNDDDGDRVDLMQRNGPLLPGGAPADQPPRAGRPTLELSMGESQSLYDAGWPMQSIDHIREFCAYLEWVAQQYGPGAAAWGLDAWADSLVVANATVELAQETLWQRLRDVPVQRPLEDGVRGRIAVGFAGLQRQLSDFHLTMVQDGLRDQWLPTRIDHDGRQLPEPPFIRGDVNAWILERARALARNMVQEAIARGALVRRENTDSGGAHVQIPAAPSADNGAHSPVGPRAEPHAHGDDVAVPPGDHDGDDVSDDGDETGLMQTTPAEEARMDGVGLQTETRRLLRDLLRSLDNIQQRGEGPEYRWGVNAVVASWDDALRSTSVLRDILARRTTVLGWNYKMHYGVALGLLGRLMHHMLKSQRLCGVEETLVLLDLVHRVGRVVVLVLGMELRQRLGMWFIMAHLVCLAPPRTMLVLLWGGANNLVYSPILSKFYLEPPLALRLVAWFSMTDLVSLAPPRTLLVMVWGLLKYLRQQTLLNLYLLATWICLFYTAHLMSLFENNDLFLLDVMILVMALWGGQFYLLLWTILFMFLPLFRRNLHLICLLSPDLMQPLVIDSGCVNEASDGPLLVPGSAMPPENVAAVSTPVSVVPSDEGCLSAPLNVAIAFNLENVVSEDSVAPEGM
ncbi:unnamed protein product [Symbiodinium sp. CCMP2592]|nr:unnamed protein product [Symbiodinium sp. CCMP2592]